MEKMKEILELMWLGNSVASYLTVFFIITAGITVVKAADKYVFSMIKKIASGVKNGAFDTVVKFGVSTIMPFLYFGIFFAALKILKLGKLAKPVEAAAVIVLTALVLKFFAGLVNHIFEAIILKGSKDDGRVKSLKGLSFILKTVIWIIGFIIVLDNLGYKVSTIVAGLGIGGIAVALAAQAILGDLFSYFSIILDKPFETGDFIIVEDTMGTVENIGIKTTRIRSLSGEEVICANSLLTGSKIKNYKRMFNRRVVFTIGVVYGTPKEKLVRIPVIIRGIIESIPEAKFDRSHFAKFGDFSLDFESVYYVEGNDYNRYMDAHQIINFSIYSQFAQEGIEFAYPTQTLYLNKNSQV